MSEFTHLIDLASARLGGQVLVANDEFFAEKENLLKPEAAVFIPGEYTDRGKWMDGWETRRRRTPGHDWCIIKLGLPGVVHSLIVDTAFFTGNFPSHCWVEGCGLPAGADAAAAGVVWHPLLDRVELAGDARNPFNIPSAQRGERRVTHLRLNIFPDGGVARLRVMGEALPDWTQVFSASTEFDLAAVHHGGYVADASDRFYGDPRNMLMPYAAANMGDGWETKRRRGPGHDWTVVHLGVPGTVSRLELDTAHFKGNYPDSASVEAAMMQEDQGGVSADVSSRIIASWTPLVPQTKLHPDHLHTFDAAAPQTAPVSHVRLNVYPDGGVSRFRVFGAPDADARRRRVVRQLNALDEPEIRAVLSDWCAAPAWIDRMTASRPFATPAAVLTAADDAFDGVAPHDWREAFRHHPRIGEREAARPQSEVARSLSEREQAAAAAGAPADREALSEASRAYEVKFGHVFLAAAAGRTTMEILALLQGRMSNTPDTELGVAAGELRNITRLRMERLLG
ncbi:MAG: allantoicase [Vicinamibacterales bacterium]